MLIKLGIVYGSSESISLIGNLSNYIFRQAVIASSDLAVERGNFPGYDSKIWDAEIIKNNFDAQELSQLKTKNHLRNCSLLSVAPTGSIGTLLSISTGVEP